MDGSVVSQSLRVPIIQDPNYTVSVQILKLNDTEYPFVHCDVRLWTASVLRSLRSDWNTLLDLHKSPFLATSELGDEKHYKFLELFGFTFLQTIEGADGITRNLFISGNIPTAEAQDLPT